MHLRYSMICWVIVMKFEDNLVLVRCYHIIIFPVRDNSFWSKRLNHRDNETQMATEGYKFVLAGRT